MQRNPAPDSELASWRAAVRRAVERRLESATGDGFGESLEPYSADATVGTPPLIVLFAGRHLADDRRSALAPAAAVEFARLHLRTHADPRRDDGLAPERALLEGDLYRSLATRCLIDAEITTRRRVRAVAILSDTVVRALEEVSATTDRTTDGAVESTLRDGAVRLGSVLYGLSDEQRGTLRDGASRLLSGVDRRLSGEGEVGGDGDEWSAD
jgi:hypothetical protein